MYILMEGNTYVGGMYMYVYVYFLRSKHSLSVFLCSGSERSGNLLHEVVVNYTVFQKTQ